MAKFANPRTLFAALLTLLLFSGTYIWTETVSAQSGLTIVVDHVDSNGWRAHIEGNCPEGYELKTRNLEGSWENNQDNGVTVRAHCTRSTDGFECWHVTKWIRNPGYTAPTKTPTPQGAPTSTPRPPAPTATPCADCPVPTATSTAEPPTSTPDIPKATPVCVSPNDINPETGRPCVEGPPIPRGQLNLDWTLYCEEGTDRLWAQPFETSKRGFTTSVDYSTGHTWRIPEIPSEEWRNSHPEWQPAAPVYPPILLNVNPNVDVSATAWTEGGSDTAKITVWNNKAVQCFAPDAPVPSVTATIPSESPTASPTVPTVNNPSPTATRVPVLTPPAGDGRGTSRVTSAQVENYSGIFGFFGILLLCSGMWLAFRRR